jgi:hypothetical protein
MQSIVIAATEQFEVLDSIIVDIAVKVMNVEPVWDRAALGFPDLPME